MQIFNIPLELETLLIANLVAINCSIVGVFVVAKRISMLSDGISHAILLGIVISFFLIKDLSSPLLFLGAVCSGILLSLLVEFFRSTQLLSHDTALGIFFPFFFSLGIFLISRYAGNIHLDIDAVILGELAYAPFVRIELFGYDIGSQSFIFALIILFFLLLIILILYKEIFLFCFDVSLAQILKFHPKIFRYGLILLLSIITVSSFEAMGSLLVVSLLIVPAVSAIMLTENFGKVILLSVLIAIVFSTLGFYSAFYFDLVISGMITSLLGIFFFFVLLFNPHSGMIFRLVKNKKKKLDSALRLLLVHLSQHNFTKREEEECHQEKIWTHLSWKQNLAKKIIKLSQQENLVYCKNNILFLTEDGRQRAKESTEF